MPFLTQGKTNWKYILIVLILAIIIGGGALWCYLQFREIEFPPIKFPPKEKVTITTNKIEYEQGEEVNATLNYEGEVYQWGNSGWSIQKRENDTWITILKRRDLYFFCANIPECKDINLDEIDGCPPVVLCERPMWYKIKEMPKEVLRFTWDQSYRVEEKTFKCKTGEPERVETWSCVIFDQVPSGKYKIRFEYALSINSDDPFDRNIEIKYAEKEITIREKIDETTDWETYGNKEIGVEFKYPERIFGTPYVAWERKGGIGIIFSKEKDNPKEYTGLYFNAYTPDYEIIPPGFGVFTGIEDITSYCPEPLTLGNKIDWRVCQIIEVADQKAIFETFASNYECSPGFLIYIYFNNQSDSSYRGLVFTLMGLDVEKEILRFMPDCIGEGDQGKFESDFYTQSLNIIENQNLSDKDREKLEAFNQIISTFKFLGKEAKNCNEYEGLMSREEMENCTCLEGYEKFYGLAHAYCATNSQKPCSSHTDCPEGEHCISDDGINWYCTGRYTGCYHDDPTNPRSMICAD